MQRGILVDKCHRQSSNLKSGKYNMDKGKYRDNPDQFIYRRPYEDAYGVLHNPVTEWDELLKYYKSWVTFVQIGEGSRRMSQPASARAQVNIRRDEQHHRQNLARVEELEAADLEQVDRNKQWKRRKRR